MEKNNSNRILWLDGLKLFACICVMISHYYSAFIEIDKNVYSLNNTSAFILGFTKYIPFFLDGAFWVRVFCIISGYVAAMKKVDSLKKLIVSVVMRYLRFAIPFFTLAVLLICVEKSIGFHAAECGKVLDAYWLGQHNNNAITLMDVLRLTFLFDYSLDAVLWTIMPIFVGTCVVFLIRYILEKINVDKKYWGKIYLLIFLLSIVRYDINSICASSCIFGAALFWLIGKAQIEKIRADLGIVILVIMVSFLHEYIIQALQALGLDVPVRFGLWGYGYILYGGLLIILLNKSRLFKRVFSSRVAHRSNVSFAIYILHMPIIMSVSSALCLWLLEKVSYTENIVINLVVYVLVVLACSYLYDISIGTAQNDIISKMKTRFIE